MTNLLRQGVPPLSEGPACPLVLIIVPVRELAIQIFQEARKFAYRTPVRPVVVYGGVSVPHQLQKLAEGCHILVATPGRLEDFVRRERVSIGSQSAV